MDRSQLLNSFLFEYCVKDQPVGQPLWLPNPAFVPIKKFLKGMINTTFSLLLAVVLFLLIFIAYGSINNRWYRVITVEGNSMSPTLWFGDLIVVTPPDNHPPVNTIVLMKVDGKFVTHRIVGYDPQGKPITKGDANQDEDRFSQNTVKIMGIYRFRLPGFGYPLILLSNLKNRVAAQAGGTTP